MAELILGIFIFTWLIALAWILFYYRFRRKYILAHEELAEQFRDLPGFDAQGRGLSLAEIKALFSFAGFLLFRRYSSIRNLAIVQAAEKGRLIFIANLTGLILLAILMPTHMHEVNELLVSLGSDSEQIEDKQPREFASEEYDLDTLAGLDQAILANPRSANLYFRWGMLHEQNQDFASAYEDFSEARVLEPDHYNTYLQLDYILARESRWNEVIRYWDIYLERNPDDAMPGWNGAAPGSGRAIVKMPPVMPDAAVIWATRKAVSGTHKSREIRPEHLF